MSQTHLDRSIIFGQQLSTDPYFKTNSIDVISIAGSRASAYRRLKPLIEYGIAKARRGKFIANTELLKKPITVIKQTLPSLESLKKGKRFGKYYDNFDIQFALNNINHKLITLDYKAWDLTGIQYPSDLYLYVDEDKFDSTTKYLKEKKFSIGNRGHVIILPALGNFSNEIERVFLDCLAKGGRSIKDAVAIALKYKKNLNIVVDFSPDLIEKVQEDLSKKYKNFKSIPSDL